MSPQQQQQCPRKYLRVLLLLAAVIRLQTGARGCSLRVAVYCLLLLSYVRTRHGLACARLFFSWSTPSCFKKEKTRVVLGNLPVVAFTAPSDGPGIPPFTGIISCYRLPPRALPPKNEIPYTVKKLPSHLLSSEGIIVRFMFNRLPANKYRQL